MTAGRAITAALLLVSLSACEAGQNGEAQAAATAPPPGQTQLWQVDVVGANGKAEATMLACVDDELRKQFLMTRTRVNGGGCTDITPPVEKSRGWALRCQTQGRWFTISSSATGDETYDFRLDVAMTPVFPDLGTAHQIRRFRRLGACPAGWRIGDQAKPGERPRRAKAG
ncbi:MAG: hypothetical protein ACXU8S_01520 [Phenylobacterium sp.]